MWLHFKLKHKWLLPLLNFEKIKFIVDYFNYIAIAFVNTWYWLKTIEFRVELNVLSWRNLWNGLLKNLWNFPILKYYWFVWMCLCFSFLISVFNSENASHICYYAIDIVQLDEHYYLYVYILWFFMFLLLYTYGKIIIDYFIIK